MQYAHNRTHVMSTTPDHFDQLLRKYLDGSCTPEEVEQLYAWLQTSAAHKPLLQAMQQDFEAALKTPAHLPAATSDRMETRLLQEISQPAVVPMHSWHRPLRRVAAAAVVVALAGSAAFYFTRLQKQKNAALALHAGAGKGDILPGTNRALLTLANGQVVTLDSTGNQVIQQANTTVHQHNGQLQYAVNGADEPVVFNTLTVPRGGQFTIVLPDGSKVWLNAASRLHYPTAFKGGVREVELEGQGYFEVAKDIAHPFTVKVNKTMEVQVLGTGFDIMAYPDEKTISTTLVEGAVKVVNTYTARSLKPGQQALLDPATGEFKVQPCDVDQAIAWKTGFFEFDNADISQIMRQLSRWYDIDVVNHSAAPGHLFGGRISRNLPLSEILKMLEASGARFNVDNHRLDVLSVQ